VRQGVNQHDPMHIIIYCYFLSKVQCYFPVLQENKPKEQPKEGPKDDYKDAPKEEEDYKHKSTDYKSSDYTAPPDHTAPDYKAKGPGYGGDHKVGRDFWTFGFPVCRVSGCCAREHSAQPRRLIIRGGARDHKAPC
jgi:hypothetical protein